MERLAFIFWLLVAIPLSEYAFVIGSVLIVIGLAMIYPPAAFLVPGTGLVALSIWATVRK